MIAGPDDQKLEAPEFISPGQTEIKEYHAV
jgi:hypothetical protein